MSDDHHPSMDLDLMQKLIVAIGEVSEITGVPQRQIRYWEEKGFISSIGGEEGTTRRYDFRNIKKIMLIKELLDDGFTLAAAAKKVETRIKTLDDVFRKLSGK
jgi:MerR family transcriptional regulator, global nitrogen regulator